MRHMCSSAQLLGSLGVAMALTPDVIFMYLQSAELSEQVLPLHHDVQNQGTGQLCFMHVFQVSRRRCVRARLIY